MKQDPDRRHPLHDALCAYHLDEDVARELATSLEADVDTEARIRAEAFDKHRNKLHLPSGDQNHRFTGRLTIETSEIFTTLEAPVYASRGRWHQLVGSVDVYMTVFREHQYTGVAYWTASEYARDSAGVFVRTETGALQRMVMPQTQPVEWRDTSEYSVGIEVKARITSLGDLVRQIQKYRHEWANHDGDSPPPRYWVVSSPSMTEPLVKLLKSQDIVGVRPGAKFLAWCDAHGLSLPPDARKMVHQPQQLMLGDGPA